MVREVCDVLGLQLVGRALLNIHEMNVGEFRFRKDGGRANKMVNEAGLYALVMRSNKPNAKAFQKWTPVGWSLARSCPRSARTGPTNGPRGLRRVGPQAGHLRTG
ncbi:Bro-N domain-containing protein [Paracoccus sp. SJTW-4]|uniref:BRO-N domain-containing protein n=1 Tax=Paracoccus sp. SJTW-4 TaxID=3078428 RepID=UPI0039EB3DAA